MSSDKLCSSQIPMKTCEINAEPSPRTRVVDSQSLPVPSRNYAQSSRMSMINNPHNSFNRYPYSFRPPFGGYSYGYNGYNPSYPSYSGYGPGMFSGYGANGYGMTNSSDSR
jgi:hypothetical protein